MYVILYLHCKHEMWVNIYIYTTHTGSILWAYVLFWAPAGLLKSVATYDVFTSMLLDGKSPCQNRLSKKRRLGRRKLLDLRVEAYQLQLESNYDTLSWPMVRQLLS